MPSRAYVIAQQFKTWAQQINQGNGFNTNAGGCVDVGREFYDADTDVFPFISILYAGQTISSVEDEHLKQLNVTVAGYIKIDGVADGNLIGDQLAQDINAAILTTIDLDYVQSIIPTDFENRQPDPDSIITRVAHSYAVNYFESHGA